ncbi:MAG: mannose-1-phosphate guanylyltransferase [Candidatus Eisenbacteria bacterium]|uniref:Mannose-1-phosphate guanylyltransferase n=1 Tax=Eiseniibacteriota bacterium TaxID=2212470 RepID=A0A9D6L7K4_UNCEI|nr:mannose-1-phosphate guanylyltransferase [Candidatus Eisenbacteria bacterium]MBI3539314.1 mannose-1-phosphate guanylyltransferase [Candidatus Eisenbacteria bacterium]
MSGDDRGVLVLAGGRGERFWPWSTPSRPKQLLPLASGGRTLLAATIERARRLARPERIVIVTAADLVDEVRRECKGVTVLGEPIARNTAPAIAAGMVYLPGVTTWAVLAADHLIDDTDAFARDLDRAFAIAERDPVLVTIGIPPRGVETNFGYIQRGARLADRVYRVARFKEKPERALAEAWSADGEHLWNASLFVWRRSVFMDALEVGRPEMARVFRDFRFASGPDGWRNAAGEIFPTVEAISVDYAVLEHAPNTIVIEATFDWDDLGSWGAWARRQPRDARGNVRFGDAIVEDCDDCVVVGEGGTAAAVGLRDMVVVHSHGATLACRLDRTDHVRRVSAALRDRSPS